jgi:hypothetical protein
VKIGYIQSVGLDYYKIDNFTLGNIGEFFTLYNMYYIQCKVNKITPLGSINFNMIFSEYQIPIPKGLIGY